MRCSLGIVALQVRSQGKGRLDKKNFTLLYNGNEDGSGLYGTGFIISKNMRKPLLEFAPAGDRLRKVRLDGRFRNITLISA